MLRARILAAALGGLCFTGIADAGANFGSVHDVEAEIGQSIMGSSVDAHSATINQLAGHCRRGGYYRGGGGYYNTYYRGNYGYGYRGYGNVNVYRAQYYPVAVPRYPVYRTNYYGGWGCY